MAMPNWASLEQIVVPDELGTWMWMDAIDADGVRIDQYKHIATRRYLNLDGDGNAYRVVYDDDGWTPWDGAPMPPTPAPTVTQVPLAAAIEWALS